MAFSNGDSAAFRCGFAVTQKSRNFVPAIREISQPGIAPVAISRADASRAMDAGVGFVIGMLTWMLKPAWGRRTARVVPAE